MSILSRVLALVGLSMASWAAYADEALGAGPNPAGQWVMLGGFVLIFYFLIWRPQNKRQKAHQSLVAGLAKGDEVVTTGGLLGRVSQVGDHFIVVALADNVEVRVQKQAVSTAMPKGTLQSSL